MVYSCDSNPSALPHRINHAHCYIFLPCSAAASRASSSRSSDRGRGSPPPPPPRGYATPCPRLRRCNSRSSPPSRRRRRMRGRRTPWPRRRPSSPTRPSRSSPTWCSPPSTSCGASLSFFGPLDRRTSIPTTVTRTHTHTHARQCTPWQLVEELEALFLLRMQAATRVLLAHREAVDVRQAGAYKLLCQVGRRVRRVQAPPNERRMNDGWMDGWMDGWLGGGTD